MIRILGLDPGESTGWGTITVDEGNISLGLLGVTKDKTLVDLIDHIRAADVIVYEGFWLRPDKAKKGHFDWHQNKTEQVIGSLKTIAKLHGKAELVEQQPAVKPVGYGFAGMRYVKGARGKHAQDAIAHACYYAVRKLRATPVRKKILNSDASS